MTNKKLPELFLLITGIVGFILPFTPENFDFFVFCMLAPLTLFSYFLLGSIYKVLNQVPAEKRHISLRSCMVVGAFPFIFGPLLLVLGLTKASVIYLSLIFAIVGIGIIMLRLPTFIKLYINNKEEIKGKVLFLRVVSIIFLLLIVTFPVLMNIGLGLDPIKDLDDPSQSVFFTGLIIGVDLILGLLVVIMYWIQFQKIRKNFLIL